jgi:3-hydroxyacyl-[acyl-carrier-protein] dehydratase
VVSKKKESQGQEDTQKEKQFEDILLEKDAISKLIKHRDPFLFIDKVLVKDSGASAVGYRNVSVTEDYFRGHFPNYPVMPGVLLIEVMAQTAAVCRVYAQKMAMKEDFPHIIPTVYLVTVNDARFRVPVIPDCCLEIYCTLLKSKLKMNYYKLESKVDGVLVAESELGIVLAE